MPQPVIDVSSNLNENLERWSKALKGGGDKLSVFKVIYSGKRRRWTAKEIVDRLQGEITQKRVTEVGKKLVGDALVNQLPGVFPIVYEKRGDVHHYKAKILAGARGRTTGSLQRKKTVREQPIPKRKGSNPMPDAEAAQGKRVVEDLILRLCTEKGVSLTKPVAWFYDSNRMSYWFTCEIDGQEKKWQLSYEKITDSVEDTNVRREIEKGLRTYVIPTPQSPMSAPKPDSAATLPPDPAYDVFLCHASEDKGFVDPLAQALKDAGVSVWYDKDLMSWGDDLRGSIDRGLVNSKYGIVVFSKAFLKKKRWTEHELNGLFAKERDGRKVILPIWHDITQEDLAEYSLSFVDRIAMMSDRHPISEIVKKLKEFLGK
jgi:hypothetical protein